MDRITDLPDMEYGKDPDFVKRTRTEIPIMILEYDFDYKAMDLFAIACFIESFLVKPVIFSFVMYKHFIFHHIGVFYFNTRSYMYKISFTHVKFYLGRAFELFGITVSIKLSYTQLSIDNDLILYYTVNYWLNIIYLPVVTNIRFTGQPRYPVVLILLVYNNVFQ